MISKHIDIFLQIYKLYFLFLVILLFEIGHVVCNENVYSFLVKIEAKGKILDCAGTILTPCVILTSAHCVEGIQPSEITVTHITKSPNKYKVSAIIIHPKYKSVILGNDIAVLQTVRNFERPWSAVVLNNLPQSEFVRKCSFFEIIGWSGHLVNPPSKNDKNSTENITVIEKPMKAPVKLISNEECATRIKNFGGIFQGQEKLCGVTNEDEGENGCFTGPGGPLLCFVTPKAFKNSEKHSKPHKENTLQIKYRETLADPIDLLESFKKLERKKFKREVNEMRNLQIGVVSWGKSCSEVPSVYVRTDFYYNWIIKTVVQLNIQCQLNVGNFTFLTPLKSEASSFQNYLSRPIVLFPILIKPLLLFLLPFAINLCYKISLNFKIL